MFSCVGQAICAEIGQFADDFDEDDRADDEDEFVVLPGCCDNVEFEEDDDHDVGIEDEMSVFLRRTSLSNDSSTLLSASSSYGSTTLENPTMSDLGLNPALTTEGSGDGDEGDESLSGFENDNEPQSENDESLIHNDEFKYTEPEADTMEPYYVESLEESDDSLPSPQVEPPNATTIIDETNPELVSIIHVSDDSKRFLFETYAAYISETSDEDTTVDPNGMENKNNPLVITEDDRDAPSAHLHQDDGYEHEPPTSNFPQNNEYDYEAEVLSHLLRDNDDDGVVDFKDWHEEEEPPPKSSLGEEMFDDDDEMDNEESKYETHNLNSSDGEKTQQTSHRRIKKEDHGADTLNLNRSCSKQEMMHHFIANDKDVMDVEQQLESNDDILVFMSADEQFEMTRQEKDDDDDIEASATKEQHKDDDDDEDIFAGLTMDESDVFDNVREDEDEKDNEYRFNYVYGYQDLGSTVDELEPPSETIAFLHHQGTTSDDDGDDFSVTAKFLDMQPERIAFQPHRSSRPTIRIRDKEACIHHSSGLKRPIIHRASKSSRNNYGQTSCQHSRTSISSYGRRTYQKFDRKAQWMDARANARKRILAQQVLSRTYSI